MLHEIVQGKIKKKSPQNKKIASNLQAELLKL